MSTKARRRKFLDILCASLGIENPADSRRGDAAQAYIDFGEEQCLAWLLKARGDIRVWEELAGIKQARKLAHEQKKEKNKAKRRKRKNAEHLNAIRNVAFLKQRRDPLFEDICVRFGILDRADWRRDFVALAIVTHGRGKCIEWLQESGDDFAKWEGLVDIGELPAIIMSRRDNSENELVKSRFREKVAATASPDDSKAKLKELRRRMENAESKEGKVGELIRSGLKEQIKLLEAKINSPNI